MGGSGGIMCLVWVGWLGVFLELSVNGGSGGGVLVCSSGCL